MTVKKHSALLKKLSETSRLFYLQNIDHIYFDKIATDVYSLILYLPKNLDLLVKYLFIYKAKHLFAQGSQLHSVSKRKRSGNLSYAYFNPIPVQRLSSKSCLVRYKRTETEIFYSDYTSPCLLPPTH